MHTLRYFLFFCLLMLSGVRTVRAQSVDSDELFRQAREAAFDRKDYEKAKALCQQALTQSPNYADIRNFLGRLYTWEKKVAEANEQFTTVLKGQPQNREALVGLIDLNYWNDRPVQALTHANTALQFYTDDVEIRLKKVRVLDELRQYSEAYALALAVLKAAPANADARSLVERIKANASQNSVALSYDYLYFDKNYNDALHKAPWQVASLTYGRTTRLGSLAARVNYANRFSGTGFQAELDAYPRLSPTFYAYVSVGLSGDEPIFPRFRAGASLYANLPRSFEAEVGARYLKFSSPTWIYTASAGKYVSSFWINLRTYLIPGDHALSKTFIGTVRYYYGGADDYLGLSGGTGLSPDETRNVLLGETRQNLLSQRASAEFRKGLTSRDVLSLTASWYGEEQANRPRGSQWGVGVGYKKRF
ncbi:YaiO family outer membrane beta-barrel protein [Tellurirhabdus rosea]|uniref:YaiO family outer membrane beta-barrel protein n=1 Tax=Tellurirhabdus rosea TaxID=2674997 RepID=UPI002256C26B|nr:YaiO family outer membrane beta-barrel protein [Tellurirhabdus rosea]